MAGRTMATTPVDAARFHIDGPVNLAQVEGRLHSCRTSLEETSA